MRFKHYYIGIICFLIAKSLCAQDYVITTRGDTVRGEVKFFPFPPDMKVIVYDQERNKTSVPILKTRKISFEGEIYQPVRKPAGYAYMKVLKSGYLSLFAYQLENQTAYDGRFLQKLDGTSLDVPNLSFRKIMANFLDDCPAVETKLENGEFKKSDLSVIVEEYNACIQDKTNNIVTAKQNQAEANPWATFEEKIAAGGDFEGKSDALEIVHEIREKVGRGEKVPKFIIESLKNTLANTDYSEELNKLLTESGL